MKAATGAIAGPDPRGCRNVEPWQTTWRGLASYTIPKIDVLISAVLRSQPEIQLSGATVLTGNTSAQWQVPNSVIVAALGHLPPGATATGNTIIPLADNDHRVFSDERRTQIDMRFAKILRFGRTRTDVGVDLNNLLNTNYATGLQHDVHLQHRQRAAPERLGHADEHLQPAVRAPELHGELLTGRVGRVGRIGPVGRAGLRGCSRLADHRDGRGRRPSAARRDCDAVPHSRPVRTPAGALPTASPI